MRRILVFTMTLSVLLAAPRLAAQAAAVTPQQFQAFRNEIIEAINRQRAAYAEDIQISRDMWRKQSEELQASLEYMVQLRAAVEALQKQVVALQGENDKLRQQLKDEVTALRSDLQAEQAARAEADQKIVKQLAAEISAVGAVAHAAETPSEPAPTGRYTEYVVQRGDTLSAISQACGVSVKELKRINNLPSDNIAIGRRLKIPEN